MNEFELAKGVFQTDEVQKPQDIFQELAEAPWSVRDVGARKSFAKYLLNTYPNGSYHPV